MSSGFQVSQGASQDGIVVGNTFDKYGTTNPIAKRLNDGFARDLQALVKKAAPRSIHEVGCGEGYWTSGWRRDGIDARGTDFSSQVIAMARENARETGVEPDIFQVGSVYDVTAPADSADLIVCCEVLEHVDDPVRALDALRALAAPHYIFSVPREPIWRVLNLARGKYIGDLGNTPGHIQHWSRSAFVALLRARFEVLEVRSPLPWTMALCRPGGRER